LFEAVISAIIQGVTEFLPVSSSGHIIILSNLFNYKTPDVHFQVWLHFASLLAVIFVLRRNILELFKSGKRTIFLIVAASIPILVVGLVFGEKMAAFFDSASLAATLLMCNGVVLFLGHIGQKFSVPKSKLNIWRALVVGIAQVFAVFPGISRSGVTISSALLTGADRKEAYRFSFLLFIPVMLSVLLYDIKTLGSVLIVNGVWPSFIGGVVSFFVSVAALKVLYSVLNKSKLYIFSIYCFIAGAAALILL